MNIEVYRRIQCIPSVPKHTVTTVATRMGFTSFTNFNCQDDNTGLRWKKWLRSFEIYLSAKDITGPSRKKNLLLHSAGIEVQDIYFTLAASEDKTDEQYNTTVTALNEYFAPKSNTVYERYIFRSLKQTPGERVNSLLRS